MVPFGARKVREFGYQALPHAKRTGHAGPISRAQRQVPNRRGMLWSAWWVNVRESESTDILVFGPAMQCVSAGSASGERTGAWCQSPRGGDLSCAMLATGTVLRWERFWTDHQCE